MKAYIHDVFYHILVEPQDIPNIGLIFPIIPIIESLAVMPLVPLVGWAMLSHILCTTVDMIVDMENKEIWYQVPHHPYPSVHSIIETPF